MPPFLDKLIRCHREFLGNLSRPVPFQVLLLVLRYSSVTQSCPTLCYPMDCSNARFPYPAPTPRACSNSMSIESVMPSNHLILCRPLLPPSIFPSIKVFSIESVLHIRWPKYWNFSISPSNEYSGLTPLRLTGLISLVSKGLSRVFSNTTVQKHQFFGTLLSLWSNSHIYT